jgi:hypothetical protein
MVLEAQISSWLGLIVILLLLFLLVQKELIRAYGGLRSRTWMRALNIAIATLLLAFGLIMVIRLENVLHPLYTVVPTTAIPEVVTATEMPTATTTPMPPTVTPTRTPTASHTLAPPTVTPTRASTATDTPVPPTDIPAPTETPTPTSISIPTPTSEVDFKIVKQDLRRIRPDKCDVLPEIEIRVLDVNGEPLDNVRLEVYWDGGHIFKNSGWLGPGYDKANVTAGTFWVKVTGGVPPFDENLYASEVSRPLSTDQPTQEDLEKSGYCQPDGECAECSLYSYEVTFQRQW